MRGHSSNDSVAVTPDVTTIVSGQDEYTLMSDSGNVYSVAVTPDGTMIVSGSWDKTIKLWDCSTARTTPSSTGPFLAAWISEYP